MILVFTGNGKGKTTAALGHALRGCGSGRRVLMVQFIKGDWRSGEEDAVKKLGRNFKLVKGGLGFVGILGDNKPRGEHKKKAEETWKMVKREIKSGKWDLVILDEINIALNLKLLSIKDILSFIKKSSCDLILTGRNAPSSLIKSADLVTEMRNVKHPYSKGQKAKKGIEF